MQAFPSLTSPLPSAPYFSHSLAVSFPSRAFWKRLLRRLEFLKKKRKLKPESLKS